MRRSLELIHEGREEKAKRPYKADHIQHMRGKDLLQKPIGSRYGVRKEALDLVQDPQIPPVEEPVEPTPMPKDVDTKADNILLIEEHADADIRRKAQRFKNLFGEKFARAMYGDQPIDELPKQNYPESYRDAYIKDGKWYLYGKEVPPPPKEFIDAPRVKSLPQKGLEWIVPEGILEPQKIMYDIMNGSPSTQHEAFNTLLHTALDIGSWTVSAPARALTKADKLRMSKGLMPEIKDMPYLKRLEYKGGTVLDAVFHSGMTGLKQLWKYGTVAPRLLFRGLEKIQNKTLGLGGPLNSLWEKVIVPGFNKAKFIPSYGEGWKSIPEVMQPAVERILKKDFMVGSTFRQSQVQRQLVTELGESLQKTVKELSPLERLQIGPALKGEEVASKSVKKIVRKFKGKIGSLRLDKRYEEHFWKELEKNVDKMDFGTGLEGGLPALEKAAESIFLGLSEKRGFKETQKALRTIVEAPFAPTEAKVLARDLYHLPLSTPEAVAGAARKAMRSSLVDYVKKTPYVKGALGTADKAKDWVLMRGKSEVGKKIGSMERKLKGMWVEKDIALEIRAMDQIPQMAQQNFNRWFMTPWKTSKVILRPATHFRNIISNTVLNDWGGLPFYRGDIYAKALKEMRGGSKAWKDFQKLTGAGGTFSSEELSSLSTGLRLGSNQMDAAIAFFDRAVSVPRAWYSAEEQWYKFAKFNYNREKGMGDLEAAYDAIKWTFNYGEVTRATAFTRQYMMPFFTWQSKVLPLLAETAVKHPLRLAKWWGMYEGMQHLALDKLRMSDYEWEQMQHVLPEYIQDGQFLLMPWRDSKNRLQLLNLTYMIPGFGDIADIMSHPVGELIGHPLVTIGGEIRANKKFSGVPIYYDWEEGHVKTAKVLHHMWEAVMPSWVPGAMDWRNIYRWYQEDPNSPTIDQIIASEVGLKITPIDEGKARRSRQILDQIHKRELSSQLKRELRSTKNPNKKRKIIERYSRLRREISN
jgi:hypothetical protein